MTDSMDEYRWLVGLLRTRREYLKLTQFEVSSRMELTDNLVNRWENFRRIPKGPMLIQWAWALGFNLTVGLPPFTDERLEYTYKKIRQESQKRPQGSNPGAQKAPTRAEDAP